MANYFRANNIIGYFGEVRDADANAVAFGTSAIDTATARVDDADRYPNNIEYVEDFSIKTPASASDITKDDVIELALLPQNAVVTGYQIGSAGTPATNTDVTFTLTFGAVAVGSGQTGLHTSGARKGQSGLAVVTSAFPLVICTLSSSGSNKVTADTVINGSISYYVPQV